MNTVKPSDFDGIGFWCTFGHAESEWSARAIVSALAANGDKWRALTAAEAAEIRRPECNGLRGLVWSGYAKWVDGIPTREFGPIDCGIVLTDECVSLLDEWTCMRRGKEATT